MLDAVQFMNDQKIKNIVIVGGGTAGWMAAASLVNFIPYPCSITLVESPEIGTIGVGEATLPGIRDFNASLGIDEVDFIRKTNATFKLAIEFKDWAAVGKTFFHPFSNYGAPLWGLDFYQCWRRSRDFGNTIPLSEYCLPISLCKANKFAQPHPNPRNPLADYKYAFHFDATSYACYLRDYAIARGVHHIQDMVTDVKVNVSNGYIKAISLAEHAPLEGDLFIDCSGLKGLLIEQTLAAGFEDWSHWLPVDRAVAVQSENTGELTPYTRSWAREEGWQWRIPLQHRVGNGYVFCSALIDEAKATEKLINGLDSNIITDPRVVRFKTGRRKSFWKKNCVALGLAAGFLEPLESTSISLIQTGISKLLTFFPFAGFDEEEILEANRLSQLEFERIRDFIILHYHLTQRQDSELWRNSCTMDVPDTLSHKIHLFKSRGHVIQYEMESFLDPSWISLYVGLGVTPKAYDLRVERRAIESITAAMKDIHAAISTATQSAISHREFIHNHALSHDVISGLPD